MVDLPFEAVDAGPVWDVALGCETYAGDEESCRKLERFTGVRDACHCPFVGGGVEVRGCDTCIEVHVFLEIELVLDVREVAL